MKKINENKLAKQIATSEGLSVNLNIGQIKEVLKITLDILGNEWFYYNEAGVIELLRKHEPRVIN